MVAPSRNQARSARATGTTRATASTMAPSKTSTTASGRYYESSRQYDRNYSYMSESYYGTDSRRSSRDTWERDTWEDLSPSVMETASASSSSVYTYDSAYSDTEESEAPDDSDLDKLARSEDDATSSGIPPATLPPYRSLPMAETAVRSSDPETFAQLFPSMDRLSIRHDDRTADGNMNLRVDTIIPDTSSRRRRAVAVQLFHLRMHDLAKREFSLRRYCRDSGREVCNSKGANPRSNRSTTSSSSSLSRSVSTALRSVKTSFRRSSSAAAERAAALSSSPNPRRPSIGSNNSWGCGGSVFSVEGPGMDDDDLKPPSARPIPANMIKLEFSNYARVDMVRQPGKQYDFEWWGHTYTWRCVTDKTLGKTSFHLVRDKEADPVAVIVPEGRSPSQVEADKLAGAWIPPCYMWICDRVTIEAMTDVADVIVSTGLMALVDDSIMQRWQPAKKPNMVFRPITPSRPHTSGSAMATAGGSSSPPLRTKAFVHGLWDKAQTFSPLRFGQGHTVVAY